MLKSPHTPTTLAGLSLDEPAQLLEIWAIKEVYGMLTARTGVRAPTRGRGQARRETKALKRVQASARSSRSWSTVRLSK